ncbi:MAG: alpha/beta hydrolase [Planctomycetia bacterium]|nr:alpha/beta hydrolase [Planctomycetia bacterium]
MSLAVLAGISVPVQSSPTESPVVGHWEGKITLGAIEMRMGLTLKADAEGKLSGTMISVDQGNAAMEIPKATFKDSLLKFSIPKVGASYTGKLNEQGTELAGDFMQGLMKMPLTLKKVKSLTKLNRPQEPKPPFPYTSEDVTYDNTKANIKLAGTLTLPKGSGPFPVVLFISGSGPQDRDESLLGHKPFLVLADYLTRKGIAVLRVDDRGTAKSKGDFASASSFDFAEDVKAGVQYLRSRKEINPHRIGLLGHSEGGLIAPMVASELGDIAFIVLLAGPGLPGEDILYLQGKLIAQVEGAKPEQVAFNEGVQKKLFAIVKAEPASSQVVKKLQQALKEEIHKLPEDVKNELAKKGTLSQAELQLASFAKPWFKTFIEYDPRPALAKVKCPVLAINGELDLQVPYKENLEAIRHALENAGNHQHVIKAFPQLNHLFQTCKTGSPTEYGKIEETMSPEVLEFIAKWIISVK